ncbi:FAD-dependent oxidoreductase [Archangium lipolyticum]|uniref:FAD-dependent oxidoreductase n=1 Tax=Archangium lipolyticum TaxID=2970465 RepID=UPI00214A838B|nr:FAD-dependent oxidoreductase [Archangium lipolyticum]
MTKRYVVVGGGVSGIAAAHYLRQEGAEVELVEQEDTLGGRVAPALLDGQPIELGGKNIGRRYHLFREFARKMGETDFEPFGINSSRVRPNGRLMTVDSSRRWSSVRELMRAGPPSDLLRFATLCARAVSLPENGYLGSVRFDVLGERRDDRPLSAYFSEAFSEAVLRPMVVRMNGAEPDEVFPGNVGTNLRMLLDTYEQPKRGMRALFDRFAKTVRVTRGTRARGLVVRGGRVAALELEGPGGAREERTCDGVVLAMPAHTSAALLAPHEPGLAQALGHVRYFPVLVVVARYAREVFSHSTRALVFGPEHPLSNAGAYGINALDVVRYTFSGRTARRALEAGADAEALLRAGEELLGRHFPVHPAERVAYVARRFEPGLCAYSPHHARLRRELDAGLGRLRGLQLAGDYLRGSSIEACFRAAKESAGRMLRSQ